jgi:hypothetical protein
MPTWVTSIAPYDSTVIYQQGKIVVYNGIVYRALENISKQDNVLLPPDNPLFESIELVFQNLKTGIQYRWAGDKWLKSFEGEYPSGSWRFDLDP